MRKCVFVFLFSVSVMAALAPAPLWNVMVSGAQAAEVIQSEETDLPGVVAELIQCKRKGGVLTVKLRMKNTSPKTVRVYWPDVKKTIYLMDEANSKKYFLLKDAKGDFIYSGDPWDIVADGSKVSWFKFPAPPPEVKEITLVIPGVVPFEDVPIEDK